MLSEFTDCSVVQPFPWIDPDDVLWGDHSLPNHGKLLALLALSARPIHSHNERYAGDRVAVSTILR